MVLFSPTLKFRDLDTALRSFRDKGGTLRTRDLTAFGIHTDALYALRDSGRGAVAMLRPGLGEIGDYRGIATAFGKRPAAGGCRLIRFILKFTRSDESQSYI